MSHAKPQAMQERLLVTSQESVADGRSRSEIAHAIAASFMIAPAGGGDVVRVDPMPARTSTAQAALAEPVRNVSGVRRGDLSIGALGALTEVLEAGSADPSLEAFEDRVKEDIRRSQQLLGAALERIEREQEVLERAWAELAQLLCKAAGVSGSMTTPLAVCNARLDDLLSNSRHWSVFAEKIPDPHYFDQNRCYAVIVATTWPQSGIAGLEQLGRLAESRRALTIVGYRDCELDEATSEFDLGGSCQSIKGSDAWRHHVLIAGNHVRVRAAGGDGAGDLYVSPAPILAGMIARGDESKSMATLQSGYSCPAEIKTLDGSPATPRWKLESGQRVAECFKNALVPIANVQGRLAFWGQHTLGTDELHSIYSVQRTKQWVEKALTQFFVQVTFKDLASHNKRIEVKKQLEAFLMRHVGERDDRALSMARVKRVEPTPGTVGQSIDVQVELGFKVPTGQMNLEVLQYAACEGLDQGTALSAAVAVGSNN